MQTLNLFPTPVWVRQLEPEAAERVNRNAMALIETFRPTASGTKAGGWATPTNLQDCPEMQELMGYVREAATEALAALGVEHDGFLITGCWANIKPRGAGHPSHLHPNNFLSGVYYVRAPEAGGNIIFHDPRNQPFVISPRTGARNQYNSRNADLAGARGRDAAVSRLAAPLGRRQCRRKRACQHQFQHHVRTLRREDRPAEMGCPG